VLVSRRQQGNPVLKQIRCGGVVHRSMRVCECVTHKCETCVPVPTH
jgi:hypothetical protein